MTTAAAQSARDRAFLGVVADGGALGAVAIDRATRVVIAAAGRGDLVAPALLDLLLGAASPSGPLTRACGGPPVSSARELFIAAPDRALFVSILDAGEVIVVATPPATSVALGWTLVRTLAGTLGDG